MRLRHIEERFPQHASDSRTQILMAAGSLFQKLGYAETSMTTLAAAVNITPAALYWHFKSKQDILFEFLTRAYEGFELEVEEALQGIVDPVEQLRRAAFVSTYIRLVAFETAGMETSLSVGQLARSLSPEHVERLRVYARKHLDRCRGIIERGVADGVFTVPDAVSAAFAITTMCESVSLWFHGNRGLEVEEVAHAYSIYVVNAVGYTGTA